MTDLDVIERVARILGTTVYLSNERRNPKWKPYYRATIAGERAAQLMNLLYPIMGKRRQQQITEALEVREKFFKPVPQDRVARNLEIARRLATGESGVALAREFGVTHQNIYYIGSRYKDMAACPSG
jgi:hypothetical protein